MVTVLLVLAALVAWQLFLARFWPEAPCKTERCKGGKIWSPDGKSCRRHGKCGGKGMRLRWGASLFH